jgi:ABC-type nitrate/sulfonate/bicarbonate transport system permease component
VVPDPRIAGMHTEVKVSDGAAEGEPVEDTGAPARARSKSWIIRLISILVVLIAWEIAGRRINPLFMSYPSAILRAGTAMLASGELGAALVSSLRTLLAGCTTASIIGIVSSTRQRTG